MDIYDRLGVRKRINGAGLVTRLGGSLMPAEVLDAMVGERRASQGVLIVDPSGLRPGDELIVADWLRALLTAS